MEPLKEMFNKAYFVNLANEINKNHSDFNEKKFVNEVTTSLDALSLNERMRKASLVLKNHMPNDLKKTVSIFKKVIPNLNGGYTNLLFPDYVALFGLDNFQQSMEALNYFTRFGSSEFAIRHFLKKDFDKTIAVMKTWAKDKNHHVRRLASEGSRPRLPWSFKLDEVIKNPKSTIEILETLKADEELYVRKSVANHLNDFTKDNPDFMIGVVSKWNKDNAHTAWIVKHASRNLIKQGNPKSLAIFNFEKAPKIKFKNFKLNNEKIKLGDKLVFDFEITSEKNKQQKLAIDYAIHYQKKMGGVSAKVFKLKEINLAPGETSKVEKKQMIKDFSTRKHYAGKHFVEILINGNSEGKKSFDLLV